MELKDTVEQLDASNAKLFQSVFDDVNLENSTFTNTNLSNAKLSNVNLSGVEILDANLTGMTVNGIQVSDLLAAYARKN